MPPSHVLFPAASTPTARATNAWHGWWWMALLVIGATALSLVRTGMLYGVGNNVFHIAYVLDLAATPAFAGDAFYLTLHKFTSVLWPIVRVIANEGNVEAVFMVGLALGRLATMATLLWALRLGGVASPVAQAAGMAVLALTPWLVGATQVGGHGLFVGYFQHSEITWGPLLAALLALRERRLPLAAAMAALVFSLNAFVGLWLLAVMGGVALFAQLRFPWRTWLKAALLFGILALPVVLWIALSIRDARVDFDYVSYLHSYYPDHFFLDADSLHDIVVLAMIVSAGLLAAVLGKAARFWWCVLGGAALLFLAGVVLSTWMNQRLFFNLHLLRVDGILQFASILLAVAAFCGRWGEANRSASAIGGMGLIFLLTAVGEPVSLALSVLCLVVLVWERFGAPRWPLATWVSRVRLLAPWAIVVLALVLEGLKLPFDSLTAIRWLGLCALALVSWPARARAAHWAVHAVVVGLVAATLLIWSELHRPARDLAGYGVTDDFIALTDWTRRSTPEDSVFLLPLGRDFDYFQLYARRQVWVDWKQGAAVMWEPAFHAQWARRYQQVRSLQSPADFIGFAGSNGMAFVVLRTKDGQCPGTADEVFRNASYTLCHRR